MRPNKYLNGLNLLVVGVAHNFFHRVQRIVAVPEVDGAHHDLKIFRLPENTRKSALNERQSNGNFYGVALLCSDAVCGSGNPVLGHAGAPAKGEPAVANLNGHLIR